MANALLFLVTDTWLECIVILLLIPAVTFVSVLCLGEPAGHSRRRILRGKKFARSSGEITRGPCPELRRMKDDKASFSFERSYGVVLRISRQ